MKRGRDVQGTPLDLVACPECGKSIPKGSIYCVYCRAKVSTEPEMNARAETPTNLPLENKVSSAPKMEPTQQPYTTLTPVTSTSIPKDILQTLIEIALHQPISILLLASRCGSIAIKHVNYLEGRGLVRTQSGKGSATISTTDRFADEFGMERDVKKMQAQLRADIKLGELGRFR